MGLDVSKIILLLSDEPLVNSDAYISNLISLGFYNFAKNESELKYLYDNPNSYKDVAHLQKMDSSSIIPAAIGSSNINNSVINTDNSNDYVSLDEGVKVIGFKNLTNHAGATSLIYMLKKVLANNYNVLAIEVNKRDFLFFRDNDMITIEANRFTELISRRKDVDVILVDLNDLDMNIAKSTCSEIIYLMESSTLMINKLVTIDGDCFRKVADYRVVLNQSMLDAKDISRLQFESGLKFFSVIPSLDDRKDNDDYLFPMLEKLGLYKKN